MAGSQRSTTWPGWCSSTRPRRQFYADWDNAARGVVSNLRAGSAPFPDDPHVTAIIGELTVRSPAFGAYWARREVRPRTNEHKHLHHGQVGELDLRYQAFNVADAPGQQIFVYTAAPGSPSADALRLLHRFLPDTTHSDSTDSDSTGSNSADPETMDADDVGHSCRARAVSQ